MGYKAVRTVRYKYIRYDALTGMDELYDLRADPSELTNLLPDRAPPGVLADMGARMHVPRQRGVMAARGLMAPLRSPTPSRPSYSRRCASTAPVAAIDRISNCPWP